MWWRRRPPTNAEMALPWGEIIYRASLMLAGLVMVFAVINSVYTASIAQPMIPLAPFVVAAAIWLIGLFFRHVASW